MIISEEARKTRNKFVSQLYDMDDVDLERSYNDAHNMVLLLRDAMEKDASNFLASLKNVNKNALYDEWFYDVKKIVNDYEDWFIYKDVVISASALIECRKREKGTNDGRD